MDTDKAQKDSPVISKELFCKAIYLLKEQESIDEMCIRDSPTMEDVIVLLGDVGANYYTGRRDNLLKAFLNDAGTVFLCIHGNHERRPTTIPGYVETEWHGGKAWVQPEYPNLILSLIHI